MTPDVTAPAEQPTREVPSEPRMTVSYLREALRGWPDSTEVLVIGRSGDEIRLTREHSVSADEDGEFIQLFEDEVVRDAG